MKGQYLVSVRTAHVVIFTLFSSLLLNLGILWNLLSFKPQTVNFLSELPINHRLAAMTIVGPERYDPESDADWGSLIPPGHGFVQLGDGEDDFHAISMYHQMHCLSGFRHIVNAGVNPNKTISKHQLAHSIHCLTYLRQMILCNADTTLEPAHIAQNTDGRKTQAVYGEGVTHVCRDWTQVRDFAAQNYEMWKDSDDGTLAASENDVAGSKPHSHAEQATATGGTHHHHHSPG